MNNNTKARFVARGKKSFSVDKETGVRTPVLNPRNPRNTRGKVARKDT